MYKLKQVRELVQIGDYVKLGEAPSHPGNHAGFVVNHNTHSGNVLLPDGKWHSNERPLLEWRRGRENILKALDSSPVYFRDIASVAEDGDTFELQYINANTQIVLKWNRGNTDMLGQHVFGEKRREMTVKEYIATKPGVGHEIWLKLTTEKFDDDYKPLLAKDSTSSTRWYDENCEIMVFE